MRYTCLLILICIVGCNTHFPKEIKTIKTKNHINIEGTKIFGIVPSDYECIKELSRYQKNEQLYIQFIEINNTSFYKTKTKLNKESIEEKGAKIDVHKDVKFNNYDAIYIEGPSKIKGELKISLIFGDETFVVISYGVVQENDEIGKKEIRSILKTLYYDNLMNNDPTIKEIEFDQKILNFVYAKKVSNFYLYTEHGEKDLNNPFSNQIIIGIIPPINIKDAEVFINNMITENIKNGYNLESKVKIEKQINDFNAIIYETVTKFDSRTGGLYYAVLMDKEHSIFFGGQVFDEIDSTSRNFYKVLETIKGKTK